LVFNIQILGSNSALAAHGRHPTAQVVYCNQELFLIDCGEGTQVRMSELHVKRSRIKHIFISHLHGDHYFGLIGLLTSYHLMGRTDELTIYAMPELEQIIQLQLDAANTKLRYELSFRPLQSDKKELILRTDNVTIYSFPLKHRIPTTGFLFEEKPGKRHINAEKVKGLNLLPEQYNALREGEDITLKDGRILKNSAHTNPAYASRSYAYCSDTVHLPELKDHIGGVDLMYHEATFLKNESAKAKDTFHSTTEEAAKIARHVGAGKMLIGHFSSKYKELDIYLEESIAIFPNTELAVERKTFEVPRRALNA